VKRPRAPRSDRAGFTLIEVLLAMALLLFGMASILGLLSFGAGMARTSTLRGASADAIESVMSDLEERHFPLVRNEAGDEVVGEPVERVDEPVPGHPGLSYSTRSTPNPENPLEYRVDVEIRWSISGTTRAKRFTTLLLRQIPFGERLRRDFVESGDGKKTLHAR
jgi:prepilin-type N-terminal cleavage/methylation domain-containing protein